MVRILTCMMGVFMAVTFFTQSALAANAAKIVKLKNGLSVYILEDKRFPLVSTRLYIRTGSANEKKENAGISHVLEHMVFKGTETRPKGIVSRHVEEVGGYFNAGTSFDYTVYLTDMPAKHWKLSLDIVKDVTFNAVFDPAELKSEKKVILAELERGEDSPSSKIFKTLHAEALKNTDYERPIIGYKHTINNITVEKLKAYVSEYYQPQNMLLVVVGNVDADEVLAEANKLMGSIPNTRDMLPPPSIDPLLLGNGFEVSIQPGAWNKVYFGASFPVPGSADVRSNTLDILAYLLGGDSTSYLYNKYQYEKQLVDSISVANYTFERVGMFYISAVLDADKFPKFWAEFTKDMASLDATIFSEAQLARAKLNIEDSIHRTKETLSGLASWKGQLQLFLGGEQGEANMLVELANVNTAQLQTALDTWIQPQRLNIVILPPKQDKMPDLASILDKNWPEKNQASADKKQNIDSKIEIIDLKNNRTLILIPDATLPYTAIDFVINGGNSLLSSNKQGLASLTARVLTAGTDKLSAQELESYLADRAAGISAGAGNQFFSVSLYQPARFNADGLNILRETLLNPAFATEEVAREKNNQIAGIKAREDAPLGLAFSNLPPFLFPDGQLYGYRSTGTIAAVESYTKAEIVEYWSKQVKQPWVMSVAGDFDRQMIIDFAKTLPIPKGKKIEIEVPKWGDVKALTLNLPERKQAHLMLIFETVSRTHPDAPALKLLQNILAGMSGLLFKDLRDDQGLGYTVTAFNNLMSKAGYTIFYIGTEPQKIEQATEGFTNVIAKLNNTLLTEADLTSGINQMEGDYYRARQSLGARAGEAASLISLGDPLSFAKDQIAKAKKLTPLDLQNIVKKYFDVNSAYTLKVLPS